MIWNTVQTTLKPMLLRKVETGGFKTFNHI